MKSKYYFETLEAGNKVEAADWGCEVGETVVRIYPRDGSSGPVEFKGAKKDAEAWLKKQLKELEK